MHRFSYLVFFFPVCVTSSSATNKVVDVSTICKPVTNPSFCSALLKSKQGADLVSLAQYTIGVARINITNTINLIKKLIAQSGKDVEAHRHYETCLLHFDVREGAMADLEDIQQLLKSGDYDSAFQSARSIRIDIDACISGESPSDPPYPDTSLLPKYADSVDKVAQIIERIIDLIKGF
ncbi:pectinesterase inhibitor 2-like [Trifolium pratense]|uniref:Uncharacterized protein n=1 Tax=Trifolium pratense TaxID=57577 RepID=A0ACB0JI88_TRIPR|nr:pectinesterase inhibitor 2-like [Trifolium pratense]CAJ2644823.1 unnamed protein product [Trifolium pratense]